MYENVILHRFCLTKGSTLISQSHYSNPWFMYQNRLGPSGGIYYPNFVPCFVYHQLNCLLASIDKRGNLDFTVGLLVHVFLKNPTSEIQIAPTRLTLNLKFCCQFISESLMCPFRFFQWCVNCDLLMSKSPTIWFCLCRVLGRSLNIL